jgi:DNA polymerase-4
MRAAGRAGRTVMLRLRFADYSRATRSHTLFDPTCETRTILAAARGLLRTAMPLIEREGLTLVGVTVSNFESDAQLALPFVDDRQAALDVALDEVRERFGSAAITRGVLVGREERPELPLLPEPFFRG